jgi:hypothetical protein
MAKTEDFRLAFSKMAPQATISRSELVSLLSPTDGAISQMAYREELPATAFPTKRRACWFVSNIKRWLDMIAERRTAGSARLPSVSAAIRTGRAHHE